MGTDADADGVTGPLREADRVATSQATVEDVRLLVEADR
jgi:hypothetical protein